MPLKIVICFSLFSEDIIAAFLSKNIVNNTGEKHIILFMGLPVVFYVITICIPIIITLPLMSLLWLRISRLLERENLYIMSQIHSNCIWLAKLNLFARIEIYKPKVCE